MNLQRKHAHGSAAAPALGGCLRNFSGPYTRVSVRERWISCVVMPMSRLRAGSTSVAFITCCCCCWCSSSSCCCVRANYVLFDVYSSRCAMRMWVALLLPCARRPCSNSFRAKPNSLGVVGGWPQLWWIDGAPQGHLLPTSRYIRTVSRFCNADCFKKWKKSAVSYWHSFSSFLP